MFINIFYFRSPSINLKCGKREGENYENAGEEGANNLYEICAETAQSTQKERDPLPDTVAIATTGYNYLRR